MRKREKELERREETGREGERERERERERNSNRRSVYDAEISFSPLASKNLNIINRPSFDKGRYYGLKVILSQ
jgi:hypothetical protein